MQTRSKISPKYRNGIIRIWQPLLFISAFFTLPLLSGCGLAPNLELVINATKDPHSVVGKYFEVKPGMTVIATQDVTQYESFTSKIKTDPMGGMKVIMDLVKQGVFVSLNKDTSDEQDKARLKLQVTDFKEYTSGPKNSKDIFFKVKLCNKQRANTVWWITMTDLAKVAPVTSSSDSLSESKPASVH